VVARSKLRAAAVARPMPDGQPTRSAAVASSDRRGQSRPILYGIVVSALLAVGAAGGCDDIGPAERLQRAQAFLDRGRANGAVVELKELLQRDPKNAEARLLLAQAYLSLNELDSAEKELVRAKDLGSDAAIVDLQLARVWSRQGASAKIIRKLAIGTGWPAASRSEALVLRGNAHLLLGEPELAVASFEQAVQLQPNNLDGLIGLTRVALKRDDQRQLANLLEKGLGLAPDHSFFLGVRSGREFADGRFENALAGFRRQLAASPENVAARIALVQALMATGRQDEARGELERVLDRAPRHPSAHYLKAVLDLQAGDYDSARRHGMLALSIRPDDEPSMLISGIASYALGRWRDARWHLQTLLHRGTYREIAEPLVQEIKLRVAERKPDKPDDDAARSLARDLALFRMSPQDLMPARMGAGDDRSWPLQQGAKALRSGSAVEAVMRFNEVYAKAPERPHLLFLAVAHRQAGAIAPSRELLELWLQDHEADHEIRRIVADLYIFDGEPERALPHLRALLATDPEDVIALNNLAWVLLQHGDTLEALKFAKRAALLAPGEPRVLDTLGVAHLKAGDAKQALFALRRAARSTINGPATKLHLAEALHRNGETAEAKALLQSVLASTGAQPFHSAAEHILREIGG